MKKQATNNKDIQIPDLNRDYSLLTRFIPIILMGADSVLDKESNLYIRLLVRLVDKAFSEYLLAKEYIEEELKSGNKFTYSFQIINHLENCFYAISRTINVSNIIFVGMEKRKKITKKNLNIKNFVSQKTVEKIEKQKVKDVRNRIEHIEEDIFSNNFEKNLFIKVDDEYKNICINDKCISFLELVHTIKDYHNFVLEIFSNLPNRFEKGIYYYDKK